MQLPTHLRQSLEKFASDFKRSELERAASNISGRYRRLDNAASELGITSTAEAMAYGATRLPATYSAARKVMEALEQSLPDFNPYSILDVGAGPATFTFAMLEHWSAISNSELIEPNRHLLHLGEKLLLDSYPNLKPSLRKAEITSTSLDEKRYDLVSCGYVLNEIEQEKGADAVASTLKKLWSATSGALAIIEPGTPSGYATLMQARDFLIGAGAYIAAPCTHMNICPLSAQIPEKWCHFSVRVERSKLHRQVKQDAELSYEDEKFAYIIVSRQKPVIADYRLIGHPRGTKAVEVDVCASSGEAKHLTVTKSNPRHKAFRKAGWGDAV